MTLPNFLVIGAQRAGTTLLHRILQAHGKVYVPYRRKEVHYFDWYFERGPDWYAEFFPDELQASRYQAVGEVTPDYLFDVRAPQRIRDLLPHCRLVVSLRNPVQRAYSWYLFCLRSFNEQRDFQQFLEEGGDTLQRGLYSGQLARYLELFPPEALLVLLFEELLQDPARQLDRLAVFLGLDLGWSDPYGLIEKPVNGSEIPRYRAAFARAQRFGEFLTRNDLDGIVRLARRCGIPRAFGTQRARPSLSTETRIRLQDYYRDDIETLQRMLGRSLDVWLSNEPEPATQRDGDRAAQSPGLSRLPAR
jgi:Sulfotransferase domain